ncbi:hypothetical protein ACHAXR_005210, partial [Thalassiosira sp. AJA248-18]
MINHLLLLLAAAALSPAAARLHDGIVRHLQLDGADFCSFSPDESCYEFGWPSCCESGRCPIEQPPCDIPQDEVIVGASYCTYSPDYGCYAAGWPICCESEPGSCPEEQPDCDITTTSTTTTFTTTTTTTTTSSFDDGELGPGEEPLGPPDGTIVVPGPSYCQSSDFTCYSTGLPECCLGDDPTSCVSVTSPACDVGPSSSTSSTTSPEEPMTGPTLPPLTLPEGGIRGCNDVISNDFPGDIIPKEVILAMLEGLFNSMEYGTFADQMQSLVQFDVRAHKICTTCEEMNELWETNNACDAMGGPCTSKAFAAEIMPYCVEGSFAYGRTMSGLLLEPIDSETKEPIVGKVGATIYNHVADPNPFRSPSETWPSNPATDPIRQIAALATSSAGTYTIVPDILGNGEDWESVRSFIVKSVYQASAVPLLLKVKDDLEKNYSCTEMDKRVAIMGYSEGGYATIAIAHAIDMLMDDYVHTYTGVGGAPINLSTAQMLAIVEMHEGTYTYPQFIARLGNSYSSTNGDLANTAAMQNFASEEFLDPDDETKNAREWAKAGLSNEEMGYYIPLPPDRSMSDTMNPDFVKMVISSHNAGNNDPCNSEFKSDNVDKICQAIFDNDVGETLE